MGSHKSNHDYQFVDTAFFRHSDWSAHEEIKLLNAIEKIGFGNWDAIALHIQTRNAEEASREYNDRFIEGEPGKVWKERTERSFKIVDLTQDSAMPDIEIPTVIVPEPLIERIGYKSHRGDIEMEYDDDAEKMLVRLNLNVPTDDELDIELKCFNVALYQNCLRERKRRKDLISEYSLVNKFFSYQRERFRYARVLPRELEVFQRLRWLCRFMTVSDYDSLVKNIQRQRDLRHRLKELMKFRKRGITKIEELPHYEQRGLRINELVG